MKFKSKPKVMSKAQRESTAKCTRCDGIGMYAYDHNHSKICDECCLHEKGWWELTDAYAGFKEGENNMCCRNGCGTMQRNLPAKGIK